MQDWTARQLRNLVHFDDGGSGMRLRPEPLDVGSELAEGVDRYRVMRVEQPRHERTLGTHGSSRSGRDVVTGDETREAFRAVSRASRSLVVRWSARETMHRRVPSRTPGAGLPCSADTHRWAKSSGGGGIRTHEGREPLAVFKTAPFGRSGTPPRFVL
jgi:hypothetical protein